MQKHSGGSVLNVQYDSAFVPAWEGKGALLSTSAGTFDKYKHF